MSEALAVYNVALGEVGYHEGQSSGGSWNNQQKYSPAVPGLEWSQGMAWCQTFQAWIFQEAGVGDLAPVTAACLTAVDFYQNRNRWSWYPAVGAMVFFGAGGGTHVGFVYAYDDTYIYTIAGNTNDDGSAEGDGVYKKVRVRLDDYVYGYGYPDYAEGITSADPDWGGTPEFHVSQLAPAVDPSPTYVIAEGDTLDSIADVYGITVSDLILWNGWNLLTNGQVLVVSDPDPEPEPEPEPDPDPLPDTPGQITWREMTFTGKGAYSSGEAACAEYIRQACDIMGLPHTYWVPGMTLIAGRETAYNSPNWQINTNDSNARNVAELFNGGNAPDGYPGMCSRGMIQAIPQTFCTYHVAGTPLSIYHPVASAAAGMNYIINVYNVSTSGSDLASKVQQADPNRPPKGY